MVDGRNSSCNVITKVTQRKIGKILSAIQNKLFALVKQNGNLDDSDVRAAMKDQTVRNVIIKNVRN